LEKLTKEQKETWIKGLMIECPMGEALVNCPLREFRKMTIEARFTLVESWDENQLDQTIAYHKKCLLEREKL
jgi:hypothetical protein